jgi:hypothetical protein
LLTCRPLTPCPLPWGEGGRRPGEGSAAPGDPTLGGMRSLATTSQGLSPLRLGPEIQKTRTTTIS